MFWNENVDDGTWGPGRDCWQYCYSYYLYNPTKMIYSPVCICVLLLCTGECITFSLITTVIDNEHTDIQTQRINNNVIAQLIHQHNLPMSHYGLVVIKVRHFLQNKNLELSALLTGV